MEYVGAVCQDFFRRADPISISGPDSVVTRVAGFSRHKYTTRLTILAIGPHPLEFLLKYRRRRLRFHFLNKALPLHDRLINSVTVFVIIGECRMDIGECDAAWPETISSALWPMRSCRIATSSTVMRCPSMRGLPPHTPGVLTMRTRSGRGQTGGGVAGMTSVDSMI
jgi:hypothetical protein